MLEMPLLALRRIPFRSPPPPPPPLFHLPPLPFSAEMARHSECKTSVKKPTAALGKGKVTPVQVAFIVDRYLADNKYAAALAAFRSEAAPLFSKTKVKEVPRGLLGLAEMLDEYITLKEQRVFLDQEKQRVDTVFQGMQEVMQNYFAPGSASLPPPPPPQFVSGPPGTAVAPIPIRSVSFPSNASPPVQKVNGLSSMKYSQPPPTLSSSYSAGHNNLPTATLDYSSSRKRRSSKTAAHAASAPNKYMKQLSTESSKGGYELSSQVLIKETKEKNVSILNPACITSLAQGTSVTKSLLEKSPRHQTKCSPKTPPRAEISAPPIETPCLQINEDGSSKAMNCSIVASETIVISPLKQTGYYTVERSFQITSPYKPNSKRKRENVRGKLDFDKPDAPESIEEPVAAICSTSTSNDTLKSDEVFENFDFDFPDLDIFNGDFSLSAFLEEIDLDCDFSSNRPSDHAASVSLRGEQSGRSGCEEQVLPDSSLSKVLEVHSQDKKIEVSSGPGNVTSMKTMTKRVKFSSPVKRQLIGEN